MEHFNAAEKKNVIRVTVCILSCDNIIIFKIFLSRELKTSKSSQRQSKRPIKHYCKIKLDYSTVQNAWKISGTPIIA